MTELVDEVARGEGHCRTEVISSELVVRGVYRLPLGNLARWAALWVAAMDWICLYTVSCLKVIAMGVLLAGGDICRSCSHPHRGSLSMMLDCLLPMRYSVDG